MDPSADGEFSSALVSKLMRRLVPFLFLLYVIAYLDRINVGFAALQMQRQLGFNDATYGLGAAMFFAGYFCFQVPSNLILQSVGARRWISVLMVVWGVVSASTAFVTTPRSFYIFRFLLGLAEAGFFPGVMLYLKVWFPAAARARAVAWFMTAAPLSGVIGGPVSGAILHLHYGRGLAGWQVLFLAEGLPAVLAGAVVWHYLVDHPKSAPWLSEGESAWLVDAVMREPGERVQREADWLAVVKSLNLWLLVVVYFGVTTCAYGLSLWLPTLIYNLSRKGMMDVGLLSAIPYVASAATMVLVGAHSDRSGERRWHTALPAFLGAGALLVAAQSSSLVWGMVMLSTAVLAQFVMIGPFWAIATQSFSSTTAAAGIAVINSVGNLGGFLGPFMIGFLRHRTGSFQAGLLVVSAALLTSGLVVLLVNEQIAAEPVGSA